MGLDQWAYARKGSPQKKTSEYEYFDDNGVKQTSTEVIICLLYTSPSPRDA